MNSILMLTYNMIIITFRRSFRNVNSSFGWNYKQWIGTSNLSDQPIVVRFWKFKILFWGFRRFWIQLACWYCSIFSNNDENGRFASSANAHESEYLTTVILVNTVRESNIALSDIKLSQKHYKTLTNLPALFMEIPSHNSWSKHAIILASLPSTCSGKQLSVDYFFR